MAVRFARVTANFPVLFTCAVDECILCQFEIEYFLHSNIHFPHFFLPLVTFLLFAVVVCSLFPVAQSSERV